jgi:hypothetical protein
MKYLWNIYKAKFEERKLYIINIFGACWYTLISFA